jgi:hypothetical protein
MKELSGLAIQNGLRCVENEQTILAIDRRIALNARVSFVSFTGRRRNLSGV